MAEISKTTIYQTANAKRYIENYWTDRSEGFAKLREQERHSDKYIKWETELKNQIPSEKKLNILDVGCGTGFFSILLGTCGHQLTGIDLTNEMILKARAFAEKENITAAFLTMDGEHLEFPDQHFDVVISRNLTWNLPNPKQAYREWFRVLKSGGLLLNYDAEYARGHHQQNQQQRHAHEDVAVELMERCHNIYHMLEISLESRPEWDALVLHELGAVEIEINSEVGKNIYQEPNQFYIPNPMFRIRACKGKG